MDRESTKHGRLLDEVMAEESSRLTARADATGLPDEGDDDLPGEPAPPAEGARPSPVDDVTEGEHERRVRREVRDRLADAHFPADRNELLRHVGPDDRGAVQAHLRSLPPDIVFSSAEEVATAFGGIRSEE
jgi:hypothetical protein